MTFDEATEFLYSIPRFTKKNGLDHTKALFDILGSPASDRKIIHVAGSNGKGSTCTFISSMLLCAGKTTGLFTSPHLADVRERIRINGELCSREDFLEAFELVKDAADRMTERGSSFPSFFEFIFAMSMCVFEKSGVRFIILEAGMGGLLDDTNMIENPVVSVITSVSLEHTCYLGETIEEIARHKAGIIKSGVPLVFDASDTKAAAVIEKTAVEKDAPYRAVTRESLCVIPRRNDSIDFCIDGPFDKAKAWTVNSPALYQPVNAALAINAVELMNTRCPGDTVSEEDMRRGISAAHIDGRMQRVGEGIYFDCAHNPDGLRKFSDSAALLTEGDPYRPLLIFAMLRDKDLKRSAAAVAAGGLWEEAAVCRTASERTADEKELSGLLSSLGCRVRSFESAAEAFKVMKAIRKDGQKLFCTGSVYFIGELLGMGISQS